MEFRSLEEFDREFFARYGTAQRSANPYDPFLAENAPALAGKAGKQEEQTPLQVVNAVVSYTIIALLTLAIIGFILPIPFGVKMLNVTSGSMQPDYNVNTLLWIVPAKYEKINVGDDVTYRLFNGELSTHRVIDIDRAAGTLTVQGIHASVNSELISYREVVGVVRFHVHGMGGVMETFNGDSGLYLKILLVLAVLVLWGASYFISRMKPGQLSAARRN